MNGGFVIIWRSITSTFSYDDDEQISIVSSGSSIIITESSPAIDERGIIMY